MHVRERRQDRITREDTSMRHNEMSERILPQGASSVAQDAMQMSNQVADLMREKCCVNSNVNMVVLGFPKEDILTYDAAAKAKLLSGKPQGDDGVTFKKDAEGNLIKIVGDGAQSKKGNLPKNETGSLAHGTASGDSVLFKKDEHGNLIKVPRDGGPKTPTYSSDFQPTGFDR
jgi:hypothetical protein